jgi:hypothetical protein
MNPVFAAKLGVQDQFDNSGRTIQVATAPGALPRPGGIPATVVVPPETQPEAQPVVMAKVRAPQAAPKPKEGVASTTTIAGLFGNWFSGSKAESGTAESEPVALRGTNTEMAAKPKRSSTAYRTASTPAASKPQEAVAKPKAVASSAPEPQAQPQTKQADASAAPPSPPAELRTAYSASRPSTNGLLTGAQPVVPVGSFDSRWSGAR